MRAEGGMEEDPSDEALKAALERAVASHREFFAATASAIFGSAAEPEEETEEKAEDEAPAEEAEDEKEEEELRCSPLSAKSSSEAPSSPPPWVLRAPKRRRLRSPERPPRLGSPTRPPSHWAARAPAPPTVPPPSLPIGARPRIRVPAPIPLPPPLPMPPTRSGAASSAVIVVPPKPAPCVREVGASSSSCGDRPPPPPIGMRPNAYDWQDLDELEAETAAAREAGLRWQDRGPPPSETDGTWRGQRFRPEAGRWGNRGGALKDWYSAFYRAKSAGVADEWVRKNPKPPKP